MHTLALLVLVGAGTSVAGDWRAVEPERAKEEVKQAIDEGTEGMFFVKRGTAKSRLEKKNEPPKSISIDVAEKALTVEFDGERRYVTPSSGSEIKVDLPDGERVGLSQHMTKNGELTQVFNAEDGTRTDVFSVSPDGTRLAMDVTVKSEKLPRPVHYRLIFVRH